jgi:ribosomal protein S18 acetylase RimI-like enzyme
MIGPAKAHDLDALMGMEVSSFDTDNITREQMERYVTNNGDTHFLLVERNEAETAVGCILVLIRRGSKVGRIHTFVVHPTQRGKGTSSRLIEAAAHLAKYGYGVEEMRLEVRPDNSYAIARYEKSGFRRCGGRRNYYGDGSDSHSYKSRT